MAISKFNPTILPPPSPDITDEEFFSKHFFKLMNLAKPGMGKTRLLAFLPDYMYPLALLDADNKAGDMPELIPLRQEGKIDVFSIKSPLIPAEAVRGRMSDISKAEAEPQGIVEIVDTWNAIGNAGNPGSTIKKKYRSACLDTISRAGEHAVRAAEYSQDTGKLIGLEWTKFKSMFQELLSKAVTSMPMNVIMNCHVNEQVIWKKGGGEGPRVFKAAIEGSVRDTIVSYFNEAYYLYSVNVSGGAIDYRAETQACEKVPARTNIKNLPRVMSLTNSGISPVIELWRRQMRGDFKSTFIDCGGKPIEGSNPPGGASFVGANGIVSAAALMEQRSAAAGKK